MTEPIDFSFAIMNGECRLTSEAIYFLYDQQWRSFCRLFGQPSRKRSVVIALVLGMPLILLAIALAAFGQWHFAIYPLFIGAMAVLGSISAFFYEEYYYPDRISLSAIQDVTIRPPTLGSLGMFTITFESDGRILRTAFCLQYADRRGRIESHRAVTEAFAAAGLVR